MRLRSGVLALVFTLAALPAAAQGPFPPESLPPELKPWVPWALDDVPDHGCTRVGEAAVCGWPGRLRLSLGASGGTFEQSAWADRETDVLLPGDATRWPQDVRVDGRPHPVIASETRPVVRLARGAHRIEGRFLWPRLPESLMVPAATGIVDLVVEGREVGAPQRDEEGLLWLNRERDLAAGEGESLRLQAFRKVTDGIPLWVDTRLAFEVSGKAREVELVGALLEGAVATAVRGDLPARLDGQGRLRVQVRAGRWSVTVSSRLQSATPTLAMPAVAEPWPDREVWVFEANETQRQVELSGPTPVDPSRTDLPEEWRRFPAFLMDAGARLQVKPIRRGEPDPPPDKITLRRQLWLDQDGGAFTARDVFSGTLSRTWRLDALAPAELGRAVLDGQPQLVTANPDGGRPGVELRRAALDLTADLRTPRGRTLPAVGWSTSVDALHATLHLPPGWSVLGASGVDSMPRAWLTRWSLLGFFFVLIVSFAVARLLGPRAALLALVAMVLAYREPGAPFIVWLSLIAALALRRVATEGWLARIARLWWMASVLALVVILIPFMVDQIRGALYPQLRTPASSFDPGSMMHSKGAPAAVAPAAPQETEAGYVARSKSVIDEVRQTANQEPKPKNAAYNQALEQDPHAVLQTGPGVPTWTWDTYELSWSGPVSKEHTMRLWLLSPWANRLLTLLRLVLLLALAARLLDVRRERLGWLGPRPRPTPPPAEAVALLLVLFGVTSSAQTGTPSAEVLTQMKERLTRPAPCAPACVSTSDLRLRIADGTLSFSAEVHAQADGAWAVPGPVTAWAPRELRVDGAPHPAAVRLEDGFLHVRLSAGVHRVELRGAVPPQDSVTLQLAQRPYRASADAPGWDVVGLRQDAPADESIQLTRRLSAGEAPGETGGTYAPWLEITRTIQAGISWRVATTVKRVTPVGAPIAVRVPLLPGESLTEGGFETQGGAVAVALGRDEETAQWSSTLAQAPRLTLTAPSGVPWSEVWRLQCSVIWQCRADGLPPVTQQQDGVREPEYRPWPGESLTVTFAHPAGVPGQTVTLEGVKLETAPGARLENSTLTLQARTSREEPLALTLPAGADVQSVTVAGSSRPVRPEGGRLHVTLPAGASEVQIVWQQPRGMSLVHAVPVIGLPLPAVNVTTELKIPDSRWLLFVYGPSWGPAVLFWGWLLFVLAAAWMLSRLSLSPLTFREWLLLSLGLTQLPLAAALVVAGFFLAVAWRRRNPLENTVLFDLLQATLAAWALIAGVCLYQAVETGLLLRPDMQVAGNDSHAELLRWYVDRVADRTPAAGVISVPLWVYRGVMLAWALWLAASLLRWLGWAWTSFNEGGIWRPLFRTGPLASPVPPPSAVPPPLQQEPTDRVDEPPAP